MSHRFLAAGTLLLVLLYHPRPVESQNNGDARGASIREDPQLADDALITTLERELLQILTPEQARAFAAGADSSQIILPGGQSVDDWLTVRSRSLGGPFELSWSTVDGGGAMASSGGGFEVGGTIGQADAGVAGNLPHQLTGGFWALFGSGPVLAIPQDIVTAFGRTVELPILLTTQGADISATTFSVDFDESCLSFDDTDADLDGVPDALAFSLPSGFTGSATFDPLDTDGELDLTILDLSPPLEILPDGTLATLDFTATCQPTNTSLVVPVDFGEDPPASFGNTNGQSVPGASDDGSVEILPGTPGDCNGDDTIDAGDLSALILEIFDGDGSFWLDTPDPTFAGSPVGCDANEDTLVDAGDISCTILLIFEGPGACSSESSPGNGGTPSLTIPDKLPRVGQRERGRVEVPIYFRPGGWAINALAFSVDYDQDVLELDPTDDDRDGIPDAIVFDLPSSVQIGVVFDPEDRDGELDFVLFDPHRALEPHPKKPLILLELHTRGRLEDRIPVGFSQEPRPSFGDLAGHSIEGVVRDGLSSLVQ